jgi:hypothetical protein
MHWIWYDFGIVGKVGRNVFVSPVQLNCLAYVETRTLCVLSMTTQSVTTLARQSNSELTVQLLLNCRFQVKVEVKVILRATVSRSVCLGVRHHLRLRDKCSHVSLISFRQLWIC